MNQNSNKIETFTLRINRGGGLENHPGLTMQQLVAEISRTLSLDDWTTIEVLRNDPMPAPAAPPFRPESSPRPNFYSYPGTRPEDMRPALIEGLNGISRAMEMLADLHAILTRTLSHAGVSFVPRPEPLGDTLTPIRNGVMPAAHPMPAPPPKPPRIEPSGFSRDARASQFVTE